MTESLENEIRKESNRIKTLPVLFLTSALALTGCANTKFMSDGNPLIWPVAAAFGVYHAGKALVETVAGESEQEEQKEYKKVFHEPPASLIAQGKVRAPEPKQLAESYRPLKSIKKTSPCGVIPISDQETMIDEDEKSTIAP